MSELLIGIFIGFCLGMTCKNMIRYFKGKRVVKYKKTPKSKKRRG